MNAIRQNRSVAIALLCLLLLTWGVAASATTQRSGSWYDPSHDGEGFVVQYLSDSRAVVYWFTFTEDGDQRWFTGLGNHTGSRLTIDELLMPGGGVFGPGFDPSAITRPSVGELTLIFANDSSGRAEYTIDGVAGQQQIRRLTRPVEVSASAGPFVPRKSGSWYDPMRDGEGIILEILASGRQLAYWFTYDLDGNQAWMLSLGDSSAAQGSFSLDMLQPTGGRFGPDFDPDDVVKEPVGAARIGLQCSGGYVDFSSADPADFVDIEFDLRRLVGIGPGDCEDPALRTLYPIVDGSAETPDNEAGRQMQWLIDQLASNEPFTDAMIRERFSASWLAQNSIGATRTLLQDTRAAYPGARLIDPISMAPTSVVGILSATTGNDIFTVLNANLSEGKITQLSVFPYGSNGNGSVQYPRHASLSFEEAADRFITFASQSSVLVARIDEANQCQTIVGRNADTPRATASIFKIWILAGVADAIADRSLYHDQIAPLDGARQVRGGQLFSEPPGLPLTVDKLSTLMLGVSDNTATDMLLALAGRSRINALHAEYGHQTPALMAPQLGISEQFHLFFSFPLNESLDYVNGSESFQRDFLTSRLVPLGSAETGGGGFNHEQLYVDGSWQASPMDICGAFARHRLHEPGSDEALLVERALQAQAAQPNLRENWDRVWYKGGSLESGVNGLLVLTHAFMLEREGERPIVVVGMANNPAGEIDTFDVQSVLGRLLQLSAGL